MPPAMRRDDFSRPTITALAKWAGRAMVRVEPEGAMVGPRMTEADARRAGESFLAGRRVRGCRLASIDYCDPAYVAGFRAALPVLVAPARVTAVDRGLSSGCRAGGSWGTLGTRGPPGGCYAGPAAGHVLLAFEGGTGAVARDL